MAKYYNYRDLDLNFNKHPVTNDVVVLTETESVKRAIKNLLSFKTYEKPFHSEINSGIYDLLFELTNPVVLDTLRDSIKRIIEVYEKRVIVKFVDIKPNLDGNEVRIFLNIIVVRLQTPLNFTVDLVRNR